MTRSRNGQHGCARGAQGEHHEEASEDKALPAMSRDRALGLVATQLRYVSGNRTREEGDDAMNVEEAAFKWARRHYPIAAEKEARYWRALAETKRLQGFSAKATRLDQAADYSDRHDTEAKLHRYTYFENSTDAITHLVTAHDEHDRLAYGNQKMSRLRASMPFNLLHRMLHNEPTRDRTRGVLAILKQLTREGGDE